MEPPGITEDAAISWRVELEVHRPSRLSDERMEDCFPNRDGRWSRQTRTAVERLGGAGLELNGNWALSARGWSCPGCRRVKRDIFRLSRRKVVLARLEIHHDHARDHVWPRADQLLGVGWRERMPRSGDVLSTVRDLTSRFSTALVCSDCNSADARAKRIVPGMDSRFSFTVGEIREFALPSENADHAIDAEAVAAVWRRERDGFLARIRLLDQLILELGAGRLSLDLDGRSGAYEAETGLGRSQVLERAFTDATALDGRQMELSRLRREFLERSTSFPPPPVTRSGARRADESPSDEDYVNYSDPVSPKTWNAVGDAWSCQCCGRAKREVLRRGGRGSWTGGVRLHREFEVEVDVAEILRRRKLLPGFRADAVIHEEHAVAICSDCADLAGSARRRDRSLPASHLFLQDLRDSILDAAPNCRHVADDGVLRERMMRNHCYTSAYEAFSAFRSLSMRVKGAIDRGEKFGFSRRSVIVDCVGWLRDDSGLESGEDPVAYVEWLASHEVRDPAYLRLPEAGRG